MRPKVPPTSQTADAELLAIQALGFLASDGERLQRLLDLTGLDPGELRRGAADPAFLGGVLDHLLADEGLLLIFAEDQGLKPETIAVMRRKLPGATLDF